MKDFDPNERIIRSLAALKEAYSRFEQARKSRIPSDSFAPLKEALMWVTQLDIDLDRTLPQYRNIRDNDRLGRFVLGLRFAQNLLKHDSNIINIVTVQEGVRYPVRFPATFFELYWKSVTTPLAGNKSEAVLSGAYSASVAGQLTRETLHETIEFFTKIYHRL
jgi:hypothetical protein